MSERYWNEMTDRFVAVGSDGRDYTVVEYTKFAQVQLLHKDTPEPPEAVSRWLKLSPSGDHVNVEDGQMVVVRTKVKLTRA